MLGVFAWAVDDDNGMLLEAMDEAFATKTNSDGHSNKKHIYAPTCSAVKDVVTFKTGLVFEKDGKIYESKGWPTKCPGEGAAWE